MSLVDYHIVIAATDGIDPPIEVLNTTVRLHCGEDWVKILNDTLAEMRRNRHCYKCGSMLETHGCPRCV